MEFLGTIQHGDAIKNADGKRVFKFDFHGEPVEVGLDKGSFSFKDVLDKDAFIYSAEKGVYVASFTVPEILKNDISALEVVQIVRGGAFLNWGLSTDLFLPKSEMDRALTIGEKVLVKLCIDYRNERLIAVSKISDMLESAEGLREHDEVNCLAMQYSDLGLKVVVNDAFSGMIYTENLVQKPLEGSIFKAFVNKVREDGKIDLLFRKAGFLGLEGHKSDLEQCLNDNEGFLPLTDKSDPDKIRDLTAMSKKAYKRAVGMLLKAGKIEILDSGIKLK